MRFYQSLGLGLAAAVLAVGCETTGGGSSQFESTVYDTHRRVVKLDQNLDDSVQKLNETTAELFARVNATDTETKRLRSLLEENQVRLDQLQRQIREMKVTLYRHFNLSLPTEGSMGGWDDAEGSAMIEPPGGADSGMDDGGGDLPTTTMSTPERPAQPEEEPEEYDAMAVGGDPQAHYRRAQQAYANEDYAQALKLFDEYLALYPNSELAANSQFWKAKSYLDLGEYSKAVQEFQTLRDQHPTSTKVPFAMHNQAVAHSRIGQVDRATELLQELIENYPGSPAADQARAAMEKLGG